MIQIENSFKVKKEKVRILVNLLFQQINYCKLKSETQNVLLSNLNEIDVHKKAS